MDTNLVREHVYQKAEDLLTQLRPTNPTWLSPDKFYSNWVFRGQRDSGWGLIPKAWRRERDGMFQCVFDNVRRQMLDHAREEGKALTDIEADLAAQMQTEQHLVDQFADLADRLGLSVPDSQGLAEGPALVDGLGQIMYEGSDYRPSAAFALAQHHGVPTQLLDFSRKPMVAAFFAAEDALAREKAGRRDGALTTHFAVWAVNAWRLDQAGIIRELQYPRSSSTYFFTQDSVFLWYPMGAAYYSQHGAWPQFEKIISRSDLDCPSPVVWKMMLPVEQANELLRLLWAEGVFRASLMPTYDNIAKSLAFQFSWYPR